MTKPKAHDMVSVEPPVDPRVVQRPAQWRRTAPDNTGETLASATRRKPTLSCVIPCQNEAENLASLLPLLARTLNDAADAWEVVMVDDGSTDETPAVMAQWAQRSGFRALQLSRNFGKEAAITAGLKHARGDVVVLMDADLQHSPALIPTFVDQWRGGADVVYAVRQNREDESAIKRLGARLFYQLLNGGQRFEAPEGASDFRLMDRSVVNALLALPERNRFMKGLYSWVGFTSVAVPYMPEARAHGNSHFSLWRLLRMSLDGMTAFSTWPLRAVSAVGFTLAGFAFIYGAYLTIEHLIYGRSATGWTTIVVGLMLFSGIQLVSIGVVGEYIGRLVEEAKARPLFIVKRELGDGLKPVPHAKGRP